MTDMEDENIELIWEKLREIEVLINKERMKYFKVNDDEE